MRVRQNNRTRAHEERPLWPYLSTLLRELPLKVVGAVGLTICLTLTEGVGLLMLVPLLHSIGLDVQKGALGQIGVILTSLFMAVGLRPTLITVLAVYVLITSVRALLEQWHSTANLALQHEIVAHLRLRLYRSMSRANWLFFTKSRSSDFSHVLTHEVERVGGATYQLLHLLVSTTVCLAYVLFALKISPVMTGLVLACGGVLIVSLRGRTHVARTAGEATTEAMNHLFAAISEHVGGLKTVKSHGGEDQHVRIFARLTARVHRAYIQAIRNAAQAKSWFSIGSVLVLSLIVYVSFEILAISTAEVLLLVFLFARIMPRFSSIFRGYQDFVNLVPAFTSVMDTEACCDAASEPMGTPSKQVKLEDTIQLDGVTFSYEQTPVIQDLDLTIRGGKTTAIVGPSGAGKTTVADLIIGLIVPHEGCVRVDESALLSENLLAWRQQIGYVTQDTFLFHETIRANLIWARPEATEEEIWQALKLAAADEFVRGLAEGLDTVVGDRGARLSGGERQRLALARALLRKPSLLILDEATSNLDPENEQRILRAVDRLHGSMTIVIISHRLSVVQGADFIYVLEDGRLVESETFAKLITKEKGRFRSLYSAPEQESEGERGKKVCL
jgi:ATP-binding cassette subfamily C protein